MREILFRGKLHNGKWAYGNLEVKTDKVCIITPDDTPIGKYGQVILETVGQYTGLTDKSGKKIFEGDIVVDKYSCEKFGFVGVVKYNAELTQFQIVSKFYPDYIVNMGSRRDSIRILGNQYDNPELLERQG